MFFPQQDPAAGIDLQRGSGIDLGAREVNVFLRQELETGTGADREMLPHLCHGTRAQVKLGRTGRGEQSLRIGFEVDFEIK